MSQLWAIGANPRRRKARKSRKHRSAAQRAATRRLVAMNRSRRSGSRAVATNPRRRRVSRRIRRNPTAAIRRYNRGRSRGLRLGGITGGYMSLLKTGALGAGGALAVDVAQGFVNGFLPASMATKLNADGTPNYLNYAAKGLVAVGLAHFGKRLVGPATAHTMAAGSFTVMAYELLRPMVAGILPASMSLGYYANMPGSVRATPSLGRVGNYQQIPGNAGGSGTIAMLRSPNAQARR